MTQSFESPRAALPSGLIYLTHYKMPNIRYIFYAQYLSESFTHNHLQTIFMINTSSGHCSYEVVLCSFNASYFYPSILNFLSHPQSNGHIRNDLCHTYLITSEIVGDEARYSPP